MTADIQSAGPGGENSGVKVFTRWEDAAGIRDKWNALSDSDGDIYGSYEWCRNWWEFYGKGRELDLRVTTKGDEVTGVFRFFRETQRLGGLPVRLVRLVGCDFGVETGALAVRAGREDEAVGGMSRSIDRDWDMIHMGPFCGFVKKNADLVAAFERHFGDADVRCYENVRPHAVFDLPGSFDEFLRQVDKHQKNDILRLERLLNKGHQVEHRVLYSGDAIASAMPGFFESHTKLWRDKGLRGYFNEWPESKEFHLGVARSLPEGRVFMAELTADGAAVAQQYGFRSRDIVHWFQPTRDDGPEWRRLGVGNIGFLKLAEHAIAAGAKMMDGGGAPIDYKLKLGGRLAPKWLLTITKRGAGTRARIRAWRSAAWLFNKAYGSVWYRRVAPRIGMTGSPFSRTWIKSRVVLPR